ncbi:GH-E family nuclease [Tenacibaculum tangerinum]|uniref:GH-E family nuclease n=1 Tax=Tenacibaculum tangerinum TaxID=3038772 RepID=A0ABY8L2Q0_9FLAO|nr:GH-E family nuclease [Tenacibaculum tangerinum]WGH75714.1 GH-E family nuclease [Tenacibaculum tangerinum]
MKALVHKPRNEIVLTNARVVQKKTSQGMVLEDNRHTSLKIAQLNSDDSDEEYKPPGHGKQKRFSFRTGLAEKVIKKTAHRRKHYHKKKYKSVYTCPACRRPLGFVKKGISKLNLTKFSYTSKHGNLKSQRALTLDHYPPWAGRLRKLESRKATDEEMKDDYNDVNRLRALCKKCNESHQYESKKHIDYESDEDEEGYMTDSDESENKGEYSPFRYKKDDDDDMGGDGITA